MVHDPIPHATDKYLRGIEVSTRNREQCESRALDKGYDHRKAEECRNFTSTTLIGCHPCPYRERDDERI